MPSGNTLWTLRESAKHGLTSQLLADFRAKAARDGIDSITALVRLMRQYIEAPPSGGEQPKDSSHDTSHE